MQTSKQPKLSARERLSTQRLVVIGMMTALSVMFSFVLKIPMLAPWLRLDFSFLPMVLTGFALGVPEGLTVLLLTNVIHLFASNSGMVGQLADVLMGLCYLLPTVVIYARMHTRKGAVIGMAAGTVCLILGGIAANLYILLPLFLGPQWAQSISNFGFATPGQLVMAAVVPFNLIKGLSVSLVAFLIYKPLSPILKGKFR